jgi:hypothetical protein
MNFIHTYNMFFFCALILKIVVIYFKPSLVIILKESKCMCMSWIIINSWPSWIAIYDYFEEFINLCTSIDAWCIIVSIKHKIWNIWRLWSWSIMRLSFSSTILSTHKHYPTFPWYNNSQYQFKSPHAWWPPLMFLVNEFFIHLFG